MLGVGPASIRTRKFRSIASKFALPLASRLSPLREAIKLPSMSSCAEALRIFNSCSSTPARGRVSPPPESGDVDGAFAGPAKFNSG